MSLGCTDKTGIDKRAGRAPTQAPELARVNRIGPFPVLGHDQGIGWELLEHGGNRSRDDDIVVEPDRVAPARAQFLQQKPGLDVPAGHSVRRRRGEDDLGPALGPASD